MACKDEILDEKKIIIWDNETQNIVAVPLTTELLEELQSVPQVNIEKHIECATAPINDIACNISATVKSKEPQGIQTITNQTTSWKDEYAVKKLINLWKTNESLFKSAKVRNDVVWRQIAADLQKTNPKWVYTGTQCENKFKDIRKNYVKVKDHNKNTTGGERKTCKFNDEMEEVLGDKPCIKPVAIAGTLRKRSASLASDSIDKVNCTSTSEEDEIQETPSRKRGRIERSLEEWAMSMRQDSVQKERERERRHKERLEKQGEALATYRDLMSKLLDKL